MDERFGGWDDFYDDMNVKKALGIMVVVVLFTLLLWLMKYLLQSCAGDQMSMRSVEKVHDLGRNVTHLWAAAPFLSPCHFFPLRPINLPSETISVIRHINVYFSARSIQPALAPHGPGVCAPSAPTIIQEDHASISGPSQRM